jgi:hypothetical protein
METSRMNVTTLTTKELEELNLVIDKELDKRYEHPNKKYDDLIMFMSYHKLCVALREIATPEEIKGALDQYRKEYDI